MEYVPIWARDIRQEGKSEGIAEGNKKTKEAIERMLNDGLRIETIATYFGITVEEIKQLTEKTH